MAKIHADGVEEYKDRQGKHRWRLWRKGRKVDASSEGYSRRIDMRAAMRTTATALAAFLRGPR